MRECKKCIPPVYNGQQSWNVCPTNSQMITRVFSAAVVGVDATEVEIEVNTGPGEPSIIVVGLPDTAVKESKDRVIAALSNSGYRWPRKRTTVNLAPADIKKQGPSFDLPIALGMIATDREEELPRLARCAVAGELALTGEVRAVKGALPLTLEARSRGRKAVILPVANVREASVVEGIEVYGVKISARPTSSFPKPPNFPAWGVMPPNSSARGIPSRSISQR